MLRSLRYPLAVPDSAHTPSAAQSSTAALINTSLHRPQDAWSVYSHSFVCSVNSVICGLCGAFLCRFVSQISVVSTVYKEIVVKNVVSGYNQPKIRINNSLHCIMHYTIKNTTLQALKIFVIKSLISSYYK